MIDLSGLLFILIYTLSDKVLTLKVLRQYSIDEDTLRFCLCIKYPAFLNDCIKYHDFLNDLFDNIQRWKQKSSHCFGHPIYLFCWIKFQKRESSFENVISALSQWYSLQQSLYASALAEQHKSWSDAFDLPFFSLNADKIYEFELFGGITKKLKRW